MSSLRVGLVKREHLPAVVSIETARFSHPWSLEAFVGEWEKSVTYAPGVFVGEELIAYAFVSLIAPEAELNNIAVHPSYSRMGVASLLMNHIREVCCRRGIHRLLLDVNVNNKAALALYRRCGFTDDGVRKKYYRDGGDAQLMSWEFDGE
ncbi:ribosomal protein S18-alanine N-acetyltransferase [Chrysiogenes arsenatis]|uniref:ribosomal protein S18-alanine N-acetyltransferase n=1 Tax=Chrysiogenes arsenatis TaxID=309797 RepID=UPI0004083362|nr:ribosomal protein S18-alanine N-acetyltransferase [Chrysiogenes arsenatis]